jgi:hypothetical protein
MTATAARILTLSDPDVYTASAPVVEWRKDHWSVTWLGGDGGWTERYPAPRSIPTRRAEARLHVTEISAQGALRPRSIAHSGNGAELIQGRPAKVALFAANARQGSDLLESCAFSIVDTDTLKVSAVHHFACPIAGARAAVAPIADSDDWLVAFSTSYTSMVGDVMLGRYRPGETGFRAGPWTVAAQRQHGFISIGALGEDAWLAWPEAGRTSYARIAGVARQAVSANADEPVIGTASTLISTARYTFASTEQGAQLLYTSTSAVQSDLLESELPEPESSFELVQTQVSTGTSSGVKLAALRIPDRAVTAVCYRQTTPNVQDAGAISLLLLDDMGRRVGEPLPVSDLALPEECALAWSGSALLVTWWERDIPNTGSAYSMIRARIMDLPSQ